MVQFNTRANEILLKLVYYGPGLSGKTTNLRALHAMCKESNRGEMFSVNTQEDRTLFFDLLPINLGYIYGNSIHLQIYTVPGQVQYDASRRVVLGGADGVVFVADSSEAQMQENVDSLSNLYHNLNANRLNIKQIPFVIQYNKRDLPDAMPVGVMNRRLNFRSVPYFESVASRGEGVLDTFLAITRETVGSTFKKYHLDKKVKDFDEMLNLIEANVRANMQEIPPPSREIPQPDEQVLRHNLSVADLEPGKVADAQDLLEDALKSNMETARLYTELKAVKDSLEKKNDELRQIYSQLERANQDNLKTRRYLEGLIQSVGEAIVSFSADGRILTWNAAAEQIFGFPRAEIVGRTFHQLTPPSRAGELEQAIAQVGKGLTIRDVATSRLRKDGTEFPASVTYAPIRGSDDRVLAYSALIRDLGAQQQLERRLHDVENAAGLSRIMPQLFNDIANRLTPILLEKGMLMEEATDSGQAGRIGKLVQAVEYAQILLRPLLMVLYPVSPHTESCNLNALMQETAKRVEGEAAAAGVALDLTLDPNVHDCGLDAAMLREGLVCLLRYGLRQSSESAAKRLRVGTRQSGQVLQLVCQNSGRAMPESEARRIFDPAYAKDVESLGMSVIASVVRAHGGRISVRSQEGLGNAILMELPMIEVPAGNPPAGLQGQRVLVVDDESFLLECLVDALSSWGCRVTACALAAEAIEKLQSDPFDLIVSDIRMPGLSGIQMYEWIQSSLPHMAARILFTTGDSFDPDTRAFLEQVNAPHLGKPFDLKKLRQTLLDLLASATASS
jgi:PAS domain S-box-containing protein